MARNERAELQEEATECYERLSGIFSRLAELSRSESPSASSSSPGSPSDSPDSPPDSSFERDSVVLPLEFLLDVLGLGLSEEMQRLWRHSKPNVRQLRDDVVEVSRRFGVSPALVAGLMVRESAGDPTAMGPPLPSGQQARGLMQVLPSNLEGMGIPEDQWHDPRTNLEAGIRVLLDPPTPYGRDDIDEVLARYGGFVTADPRSYVREVQGLATRAIQELDIPPI